MGERECEVVNRWGNSAGLNHKYLGQRQADKNSTVMPCLKTLRKQKLFGLGWKEDSSVGKALFQSAYIHSVPSTQLHLTTTQVLGSNTLTHIYVEANAREK